MLCLTKSNATIITIHTYLQKQCNETGHPFLSLTEIQWKPRQQHDRVSHWRGSHCRVNTSARREK